MITLYHAPLSRSCRVRWLLEELGLDYELVTLSLTDGSLREPGYLAVNPLGRVPTLEDGDLRLVESGAIAEYLAEEYGQGRLAPPVGAPERPRYLQWMHWAEATLMPPLGDLAQHAVLRPEDQRIPAVAAEARQKAAQALGMLEVELEGRDHLLAEFSAADVMMGYGLQLAKLLGALPEDLPRCRAYLERLATRPAFRKAFA